MMYGKAIILIGVLIAGILFGLSNQQLAVVHFFGYSSQTFPLYLLLFISLLMGSFTALVCGIRNGFAKRAQERVALARVDELRKLMRLKYEELDQETSSGQSDEPDDT
ncbi:MAG TPA: DUF1049 domain-containing protein [Deltaproteobacteria bacterium]|nr:DUF1049 domain-containing protein [Deltaproteobacteria bacterium]